MKSPILEIRTAFKITQAQLGELAHISPSYICEVEKGIHPIPGKLMGFLRDAKIDVADVQRRNKAFRAEKKKELEDRIFLPQGRK